MLLNQVIISNGICLLVSVTTCSSVSPSPYLIINAIICLNTFLHGVYMVYHMMNRYNGHGGGIREAGGCYWIKGLY